MLERYPVRAHVTWTEKHERGGQVSSRRREERWLKTGASAWEVVTHDVGGGSPFRARYALLPDGALAQVAVFEGEVELRVEPPKIVLPSSARPGTTWGGEHRIGKHSSRRDCRLVAYADCAQGIEERCTTSFEDGRTVEVNNKWCGGVGQIGYSSITRARGTEAIVKIWSEELTDVRD